MLVREYYNHLDANQFEVYVASGVEDGELRARFTNQSHVFVASRSKHGGRFGAWKKLREFMGQLKPDIIHSHLLSSDFFAWWYKKFVNPRVRWVVTLHNVEHHTSWFRRLLWKCILPAANQIVAVSKGVGGYATQFLGVAPTRVRVVLNGIKLDSWLQVPKLEFENSKLFHLATIGRLTEQKGHQYLFTALSKCTQYPWQLEIFGDGEKRAELEQFAKHLGIANRLHWQGIAITIPERLAYVDVVVQPSLWEGLSLVVMEAMAAGRIVAVSTAAAAELMQDGKTGYVVPTGDSLALEEKLIYIFEHQAQAQTVAEEARTYAIEHFSLEQHLQKIEEIYETL